MALRNRATANGNSADVLALRAQHVARAESRATLGFTSIASARCDLLAPRKPFRQACGLCSAPVEVAHAGRYLDFYKDYVGSISIRHEAHAGPRQNK